jgi:heptosyltransferase I
VTAKAQSLPLKDAPRNICILRLSALGDVTHIVPVVRAIRAHWPETGICWIIGKLEHRLLSGLGGIEFIPFDKRGGLAALRLLQKQLRGREFDVLLHMQVAFRASMLSRLVKAPIRLGWDRVRSRDRHHWFTNHSINSVPRQHQVDGFLEFARSLGVPVSEPQWHLPISEKDRAWASAQLPANGPILMISPCSSHVHRNWRSEYYAKVADFGVQKLDMQPVLIGGPGKLEKNTGREIESAMSARAINLIGKDTLQQSLALMERADVLVSPDSGPVHIASALGTPVIGLYAATWSRRSGPFNSLDLCVDRFGEAALKFRNKQPGDLRWGTRIEVPGVMDLIKPESVMEKLERLYSGNNSDSSCPPPPGPQ